jgi:hypothetical protein
MWDAFWSRERSTVQANWREEVKYLLACRQIGDENPYPKRGPWAAVDVFGYNTACAMLMRSLDVGKQAATIQYETLRKMRSCVSNFVHAMTGGMGASFISDDGSTAAMTHSPTNSPWFKRYMRGSHKQMGDIWIPDRPMPISELLVAMQLLEDDWSFFSAKLDVQGMTTTCLTGITIITGFFAAMRGEAITRVDVGSMRAHWEESVGYPDCSHVPLMLAGRFKREIGEKLFCQPLAMVSKLGIKIGRWFH